MSLWVSSPSVAKGAFPGKFIWKTIMAKKKKRKASAKQKGMSPLETTNQSTPHESDGTSGDGIEYTLNDAGDNIRCTHLATNGDQCKAWSREGHIFCYKHAGSNIVGSGHTAGQRSTYAANYRFDNKELDAFYENCINHPAILDIEPEIGI